MSWCDEFARIVASDEYETAGLLRKARIRLQLIKCRLLCHPPSCLNYYKYIRKLGSASRDAISAPVDAEIEAAKKRTIDRLSRKP